MTSKTYSVFGLSLKIKKRKEVEGWVGLVENYFFTFKNFIYFSLNGS